MASTDCAQYLNGAFGGFDPDYYKKEHASRTTFNCNEIDQERNGLLEGFQTCSVIVAKDQVHTLLRSMTS
jgi:hypothetical protein